MSRAAVAPVVVLVVIEVQHGAGIIGARQLDGQAVQGAAAHLVAVKGDGPVALRRMEIVMGWPWRRQNGVGGQPADRDAASCRPHPG